jgi:hypothetical protein
VEVLLIGGDCVIPTITSIVVDNAVYMYKLNEFQCLQLLFLLFGTPIQTPIKPSKHFVVVFQAAEVTLVVDAKWRIVDGHLLAAF